MSTLDFSNINFDTAKNFIFYTDEHVFLTGKAGTGKTTFLRHIKEACTKKLILTAPTGVAAINAGGVTLHSFFQLPIGMYIADFKKDWRATEEHYIVNRHQLLSKNRLAATKRKIIKEMELLIIDEISMVRADTLDAVDTIMRHIRNINLPFGGVQLLLIGDLYQLPPVVRNHELAVLSEHYRSPFFFDAHALLEQQPICIELDIIYRQDDETFINILNNIRNNAVDQEDFDILHTRYFPYFQADPEDNIITLTSHNAQADTINREELAKLTTKAQTFKATVSGDFPENAYPMEPELVLKEGAQVMFIKNDKGEQRRFYNGKIGKVNQIDRIENEIEIYFPKEQKSIRIKPETWENIKYALNEDKNEIEESVVGRFEQFPFKLAWAVTIHKSQGLTFDEAIIDAGKSFAPGQVYVALSRMTGLKGMILKSKIGAQNIMVDPRIKSYMSQIKQAHNYKERLVKGQRFYFINAIAAAYQFSTYNRKIDDYLEQSVSTLVQDHISSSENFHTLKQQLFKMDKVGKDFEHQLNTLFIAKDYSSLLARCAAANEWFLKEIDATVQTLKVWMESLKVQKGGTSAAKAVHYFIQQITLQQHKIKQIIPAIQPLVTHDDIHQALQIWTSKPQITAQSSTTVEAPVKLPSKVISLQLFQSGKSPQEIATLRNFSISTIMSHLADAVKVGAIKVEDLLPVERMLHILDIMKQHPNVTYKEIKNLVGDDYSYDEINLVKAHQEFQHQSN